MLRRARRRLCAAAAGAENHVDIVFIASRCLWKPQILVGIPLALYRYKSCRLTKFRFGERLHQERRAARGPAILVGVSMFLPNRGHRPSSTRSPPYRTVVGARSGHAADRLARLTAEHPPVWNISGIWPGGSKQYFEFVSQTKKALEHLPLCPSTEKLF